MNKINRRTFVKRGGAATLGSVLGLGLLPSLTRKLHATDQSETTPNAVVLNYEGEGKANRTEFYHGGELKMSVVLSCSPDKGVCSTTGVMSILRSAIYTIVLSKVTYVGRTSNLALVSWQCIGGEISVTFVAHPSPPTTAFNVAIANPDNPNESVGTLFTGVTGSSDKIAGITVNVLIGDELSPPYTLNSSYSVSPCVV